MMADQCCGTLTAVTQGTLELAQIFFSYSREDLERVKPLVAALEAEGYSLWWDREIQPGANFESSIDREIQDCHCVVVIWTQYSVESHWVKSEALEGLDRDILVPVMLDDVRIPVAFKQVQTADFRQWPDAIDSDAYRQFLDVLDQKLNPDADPVQHSLDGMKQLRQHRSRRRPMQYGLSLVLILFVVLLFLLVQDSGRNVVNSDVPRLSVSSFTAGAGEEADFYASSMSIELERFFIEYDGLETVQSNGRWALELVGVSENLLATESDYVLSGDVAVAEDMINVNVRLVVSATGTVMWETQYSEPLDDILELQNRLVLAVLTQLNLRDDVTASGQALSSYTPDKGAYREYLRGMDALRRGERIHTEEAIRRFSAAIEKDSRFSNAYAALCRAYVESFDISAQTSDFEAATDSCNRAQDLGVSSTMVELALGELYRTSGEMEQAKYHYTEALESDSRDVDATMGLAAVFASEGDFAMAEDLFVQATRLAPTYWKAHRSLGTFYFSQGSFFQAIESYRQVTLLTTANATAFSNLGAAHYYAGDFEAALTAWEKANQLSTTSASYSNMGTALFFLRRFDEALVQFQTAVKITPEDHRLWGNIGDTLRLIQVEVQQIEQAYEKAVQLAQQGLAVNPNKASDISRLSVYLAAIGARERALLSIQRSEDVAGDDFYVLYDLAIATKLMNNSVASEDYLARALDAGYPAVLHESDPEFN